ncbi:MAG: hypothetical protein IJB27_00810 [Clostridia bacterium]|nr:hypothetical protein [Clostridia bacterium]
MFNEYVWKIYLNADGKNIVDLFEKNLSGDLTPSYAKSISALHKSYCASSVIVDNLLNELETTYEIVKAGVYAFEDGEYTIDSAMSILYDELKSEDGTTAQSIFENFSDLIAYYTTLFARELPELFVPYYFKYNFNILEKIANEFEIVLPEIPLKKDYEGRVVY